MPTYTLEMEIFGNYTTDMPGFEIWSNGSLISTYSASIAGTSIIETISFGGAVPSSLEFRFNDASGEAGRSIEIRTVKINDRFVNNNNYLSNDTITFGGTSNVDVTNGDFIFDASEPLASEFTTGATQTLTASANTVYLTTSTTDEIFDALDGRDAIYLGSGNDKVNGNLGDDVIHGRGGNDLLFGGDGNDRIYGDDGADLLFGGNGNDRIHGGNDNDEIHGGDGDDRLNGNDGDDIITGGLGNDKINGSIGNDFIFGDEGNDILTGGIGDDTLDGGDGDDLIYGGSGIDIINGGDGVDYLIGNNGNDIIHGGAGDDTILGLNDDDTLYGNEGNDTINGGIGSDIIYGGGGDDIIDGGVGGDTIYGDNLSLVDIMEAGQTAVTQLNSTQWHTVNFTGTIDNAVVKMFASDVTGDPFTTRVRNITSTGFEFQLDEYDYQDGATSLENISWMAVSEGTYTLSNGLKIQAGNTTAVNETVTQVSFGNDFGSTPVVFTQLSSDNDLSAVITKNDNTSSTGFDVYMHEQELGAGAHATENIGWIAIEAGGSTSSGIVTGTTGNNVTDANRTINFGGSFSAFPTLIADSQTDDGADPGVVVGNGTLGVSSGVIYFDEEESADTEINHTTEDVGYIALASGIHKAYSFINGQDIILGGDGNDVLYADMAQNTFTGLGTLQTNITDNVPVAYWQLNDGGTTAVNQGSLAAAVDGTLVNGVLTAQAALYSGGAASMAFDGTNDHITVPDSTSINTSAVTERTIELVFNADTTIARQVLYEEGGGTNALAIYIEGGNIYFNVRDAGEFGPFTITTGITMGRTYHVAATFDSVDAQLFSGYLDGVLVGTGVTLTDLDAHSGDISIGASTDGSYYHDGTTTSGHYFDGRMSDVAIYNSVLTTAEIQKHATIVTGAMVGPAGAIDDVLYGGDGLDMLSGGEGRDAFVFESTSAFNDVDQIFNFNEFERDVLDICDLLTGYVGGTSDINDFVQISESAGHTFVAIDSDGLVGGSSYSDIVRISNTTNLNVDDMLDNENIIALCSS